MPNKLSTYIGQALKPINETVRPLFSKSLLHIAGRNAAFYTYLDRMFRENVTVAISLGSLTGEYSEGEKRISIGHRAVNVIEKIANKTLQRFPLELIVGHEVVHAADFIQFRVPYSTPKVKIGEGAYRWSLAYRPSPEAPLQKQRMLLFVEIANSLFNAINCIFDTKQINLAALDKLAVILPKSVEETQVSEFSCPFPTNHTCQTIPDQLALWGSSPYKKNATTSYITTIYHPLEEAQKIFYGQETFNMKEVMALYKKTASAREALGNRLEQESAFITAIDQNSLAVFNKLATKKQETILDTLLITRSVIVDSDEYTNGNSLIQSTCSKHNLVTCVNKHEKDCVTKLYSCLTAEVETATPPNLTKFPLEIRAKILERNHNADGNLTPELLDQLCPASALPPESIAADKMVQTPTQLNELAEQPPRPIESLTKGKSQNMSASENATTSQSAPEEAQKAAQQDDIPTLWDATYKSLITSFCDSLISSWLQTTNLTYWQQKIVQQIISTGLFVWLGSNLTTLLCSKVLLAVIEQSTKYLGIDSISLGGYKIDVLNSVMNSVMICSQFADYRNIPSVAISFASGIVGSGVGFFAGKRLFHSNQANNASYSQQTTCLNLGKS